MCRKLTPENTPNGETIMSLHDEIQDLRAQISARARQGSKPKGQISPQALEPLSEDEVSPDTREMPSNEIDRFLKTMHDTLDEFGDELDQHPRLTALVALGIGLAAGIVIGHRTR
jgi:hypothetical protein